MTTGTYIDRSVIKTNQNSGYTFCLTESVACDITVWKVSTFRLSEKASAEESIE
jgi:hypothetical protein